MEIIYSFSKRAEADSSTESQEALRNLVFLISSLSQVGFTEIRPAAGSGSTGSLFQLPGFSVPQPSGKGSSVRNVMAFQVLHNAFLKSGSSVLASIILDAVSTLLHSDPANYFILETQSSLSQFAERIHLKSAQVQVSPALAENSPAFRWLWPRSFQPPRPYPALKLNFFFFYSTGKIFPSLGICRVPAQLRSLQRARLSFTIITQPFGRPS